MQTYAATMTGVAIPLVPQDPVVQRNVSFQTLVIGNTGTVVAYVGGPTVSATNGIPIPAGTSIVIPTALLTQNLNGWYGFAASGVLVAMILE